MFTKRHANFRENFLEILRAIHRVNHFAIIVQQANTMKKGSTWLPLLP
jgi:hypothetical protein